MIYFIILVYLVLFDQAQRDFKDRLNQNQRYCYIMTNTLHGSP